MSWRWSWFFTLIWNALIHAVTLRWNDLRADGDQFRNWWESLWSEITGSINAVKTWAQGKVSYLSGYAYGLYIRAYNTAWSWIVDARNRITSKASEIYNYVAGRVNYLREYAYSQYTAAVSWAYSRVESIKTYLQDVIYYWRDWLRDRFEWIQPFRNLIASWLTQARGAIDWLRLQAIGQLQAFLRNPINYVLGALLRPLQDWLGFFNRYGALLKNFVANELPGFMTTWTNGKRILKAFLDNPADFVVEIITPKLLDILEDEIARRW